MLKTKPGLASMSEESDRNWEVRVRRDRWLATFEKQNAFFYQCANWRVTAARLWKQEWSCALRIVQTGPAELTGPWLKSRLLAQEPGPPHITNEATLISRWHLKYHWVSWTTRSHDSSLHSSPHQLQSLSCSRSHTEPAAFQVTWYVGQTNTPKWGMCSLQNPNRLFSRWWEGLLQEFFFLRLRRKSSAYPIPLGA